MIRFFFFFLDSKKKNRRTHAGSLICDERDRETSSDLPFCFMNRSRKIYFLSFPGVLSPIPTYACSPDRLPSSGSRPRLRDSPLPSGQFLFQPRSGKLTVGPSSPTSVTPFPLAPLYAVQGAEGRIGQGQKTDSSFSPRRIKVGRGRGEDQREPGQADRWTNMVGRIGGGRAWKDGFRSICFQDSVIIAGACMYGCRRQCIALHEE